MTLQCGGKQLCDLPGGEDCSSLVSSSLQEELCGSSRFLSRIWSFLIDNIFFIYAESELILQVLDVSDGSFLLGSCRRLAGQKLLIIWIPFHFYELYFLFVQSSLNPIASLWSSTAFLFQNFITHLCSSSQQKTRHNGLFFSSDSIS